MLQYKYTALCFEYVTFLLETLRKYDRNPQFDESFLQS